MNDNLKAALARCNDDDRPIIAGIFSAVVDGRRVCIATNGKKLLVVEEDGGHAEASQDFLQIVQPVLDSHAGPATQQVSRDALIAWAGQDYQQPCSVCDDGLIDSKKCEHCDGGYAVCNLGHAHECLHCKGEGSTGKECAVCQGTGNIHHDVVEISIPAIGITLDAHLIGGLLDLLPGDWIGIAAGTPPKIGPSQSVAFYGVGWKLIVAALRATSKPVRELTETVK